MVGSRNISVRQKWILEHGLVVVIIIPDECGISVNVS